MQETVRKITALRGHVFQFSGDPFCDHPAEALTDWPDGLVVTEDGKIIAVGDASELLATLPEHAVIHDHRGKFILPGFVDCHVHYPQTEVIASYGAQLIEWLNTYTFPAEAKFGDLDYARRAADVYLQQSFANGITSASVYCTIHPESVDALFEQRPATICGLPPVK